MSSGIQSSPFLPILPPIALGDLGRVTFPGTTQAGRGKMSLADRDPRQPQNTITATGPSTYTRQPSQIRTGGLYAPTLVGDDARAFRRRPHFLPRRP